MFEEELQRAHQEAKRLGISVGAALVKLGFIEEAKLTAFLAEQYGVPAVDLSTRVIPPNVAALVPPAVGRRLITVPLERLGSVLVVAMADPSNVSAIEELERLTGCDIEPVVSSENSIRIAIERSALPSP